jgi:hypothetical protein
MTFLTSAMVRLVTVISPPGSYMSLAHGMHQISSTFFGELNETQT